MISRKQVRISIALRVLTLVFIAAAIVLLILGILHINSFVYCVCFLIPAIVLNMVSASFRKSNLRCPSCDAILPVFLRFKSGTKCHKCGEPIVDNLEAIRVPPTPR